MFREKGSVTPLGPPVDAEHSEAGRVLGFLHVIS